jgi:hypothetical protein
MVDRNGLWEATDHSNDGIYDNCVCTKTPQKSYSKTYTIIHRRCRHREAPDSNQNTENMYNTIQDWKHAILSFQHKKLITIS